MENPIITYIESDADIRILIKKQSAWRGVFILAGNTSRTVSLTLDIRGMNANVDARILVATGGVSRILLKTRQIHAGRHSKSNILVKSVISGESHLQFEGSIEVAPNAVGTDAYQRNDNLLLSDSASAVSKPSLEILADEVRCTHGAATGPFRKDEILYLVSRGIPEVSAKMLLTEGFLRSGMEGALGQDSQNSVVHRIMEHDSTV